MRKTLHKWHAYGALLALIPMLLISLTGSILVFKAEIDNLLMPEKLQVNVAKTAERLPLDTLIDSVKNAHPNFEVGTWEIFDDKQRSDAAYIIQHKSSDWFKVYVNQYTGDLLSKPVGLNSDFTDWLLDLHFTLLMHNAGIIIGFVVSCILLFLALSGLIIYRKFWQRFLTLRWQGAKRILFSDMHKMVGIVASPILLILSITGGYWNAAELLHEYTEHAHDPIPTQVAPRYDKQLSIQHLHDKAKTLISEFTPTYLVLPYEDEMQITFFGDVPTFNPLNSEYASTITFDSQTGEWVHQQDVRDNTTGAVIIDSFRKLHFGDFAGLLSKLVWSTLGLSPLLLGFTGCYLFYKTRRMKTQSKHNRRKLHSSNAQISG
ncbi:PepSY domain-containing protein [Paraglaciecola sp. L1A13]|uniref:PepSY-associated TM helix domain-containing protein n=1 Tax=Paraglaciecola sp. L1A13 TaxID=2686359 RepID=UPI00131CD38F|nr:PepSY-associated TM helix domain-containing protein [Paraglaciecola sp. L1A13]